MQLYKTTARFYGTVNGVPDVETVTTVWSGSMASAGSDRAKAVADGAKRKDVETVDVNIPTNKTELINFLNSGSL